MSDNYSLIIKNGSCYVNGKLTKTDIVLFENKIKKVGNIDLNWSCELTRGQLLNTDLIMQVLSILALSAYPM